MEEERIETIHLPTLSLLATMSADDQTIYSPSLPHLVMLRTLSLPRWTAVERRMPNARVGVRVLVHRHQQQNIIIEYITVRTPYDNRYGGWRHVTSAYLSGEPRPFSYQYDASHVQYQ